MARQIALRAGYQHYSAGVAPRTPRLAPQTSLAARFEALQRGVRSLNRAEWFVLLAPFLCCPLLGMARHYFSDNTLAGQMTGIWRTRGGERFEFHVANNEFTMGMPGVTAPDAHGRLLDAHTLVIGTGSGGDARGNPVHVEIEGNQMRWYRTTNGSRALISSYERE